MWQRVKAWWHALQQAKRERLMVEHRIDVTTDDLGIRVVDGRGSVAAMAWTDVDSIAIETNDRGPFEPDVWWVLEGGGRRVVYPQGANGDGEALRAFGDLFAGFDHGAVIASMGSVDIARFVCWNRATTAESAD